MAKRSSLKILGAIFLVPLLAWAGFSIWQLLRDHAEPVSALSYHEIEKRISRGSSLTSAQLAHEISELEGKKVRWNGTVDDVDAQNYVYIDMDRFLYDVRFPLPAEEAIRLAVGDQVTFTGVIATVERYWLSIRVELRSVEIDEITKN